MRNREVKSRRLRAGRDVMFKAFRYALCGALTMCPVILRAGGGASGKLPRFTYSGTCSLVDQGDGNWIVRFITSGTLVLKSNVTIDVFILGGGAGGHPATISGGTYCGGGGGSGFTVTLLNVYAFGETSYSIVVGAGGAINSAGNSSSAFGYTANGGGVNSNYSWGGNGQSGGGGGGIGQTNNAGGTNGSNGSGAYPGNGNGQTTREFGESSGILYARGGIGGGSGLNGTANTGNGGDGHATNTSVAGIGGSGIVAIRNQRAA